MCRITFKLILYNTDEKIKRCLFHITNKPIIIPHTFEEFRIYVGTPRQKVMLMFGITIKPDSAQG